GLRPRDTSCSFAHEVAHVMLQRNIFHVSHAHEELFADWLGRELCLPRAWLHGAIDAPLTARRYRVSQTLVAVQLASIGRAPAVHGRPSPPAGPRGPNRGTPPQRGAPPPRNRTRPPPRRAPPPGGATGAEPRRRSGGA